MFIHQRTKTTKLETFALFLMIKQCPALLQLHFCWRTFYSSLQWFSKTVWVKRRGASNTDCGITNYHRDVRQSMLVVAALCVCIILCVVCITIECGYRCVRVHAAGPWKFIKFCGVWHTPKDGTQPSPSKGWLSECKLSPLNGAPASSRDQITGFSISYTTGKKGPNRKLWKLSAATMYRNQHRSFFLFV